MNEGKASCIVDLYWMKEDFSVIPFSSPQTLEILVSLYQSTITAYKLPARVI
jgi:hypothetical protein